MGIDDGIEIAKKFIPPTDGGWARFRYDAVISLTLLIGGLLVTFHILWVCGLLAFLSLTPPFARAEEMQQTQYRMIRIQASEIDARIQNAKKQVCLAIAAKNQTALDAWARSLEGFKQEYRDQIGREPNVMGCEELLIGGTAQQ